MSDVSTWRLFAFMDDDEEGRQDETRNVADWQVEDVLRWCRVRGYDHVYFRRVPDLPSRFRRSAPAPVRHHMHLVSEGSNDEHGDAA